MIPLLRSNRRVTRPQRLYRLHDDRQIDLLNEFELALDEDAPMSMDADADVGSVLSSSMDMPVICVLRRIDLYVV